MNGVNEQFQLRQLEYPGGEVIPTVFAPALFDVYAVFLQSGDVGIDGFAMAADAVLGQHGNELIGVDGMGGVRFPLQIIQDV